MERELDLILWGATGFTGRLVAEHLRAHDGAGRLRWAIGGRDGSKLDALRRRLDAPDLPAIVGDAGDPSAMGALAARTRVVCSTVGPYALHGSALLAACVEAGTDYCDLTAEMHWVRRMLDAHEERARATGARIVPTCGVDSIPSDLGVYLLQRHARERHGAPSPQIKGRVALFRGGASGGTIASILGIVEAASSDPAIRRVLGHPYSINPEGRRRGPDGGDRRGPGYDEDFGRWVAPFLMAPANTRVVRRSAALMPERYGESFRYDEALLTGRGPIGALRATWTAALLVVGLGALAFGPVRRLVSRMLPRPGDGPTAEARRDGAWEFRFLAKPPVASGAAPLRACVRGDRDPGYGSTSRMLAECACSLALDPLDVGGGFHTPASCLGDTLIERLEARAGVRFEVTG